MPAVESEGCVRAERRGHVLVLRLNRPAQRNAMNVDMGVALEGALHGRGSARAVVLTGDERAFSAGADLKEIGEGSDREVWLRVLPTLATLPVPTVAAIEGWCLGGGLELALCCDLRVAATGAWLGTPEVKHGLFPAAGGTQRLPRVVGAGRAKQLMLSGEPIPAETALAWGLVNETTADGQALERSLTIAAAWATYRTDVLATIKRLADLAWDVPLAEGLAAERQALAALLDTPED